MKRVRIFTGTNGESNIEEQPIDFSESEGSTMTGAQRAESISFFNRVKGAFDDFHRAPRRQYVFYLTARVEIGLGDGSSVIMEPGDVLWAEDTRGRGHTSRVLGAGLCAIVALTD
jgi:hypothetical protein